jgi:hypothetical protein
MSQKEIGPADKGEAGVQLGGEPGPNTAPTFLLQDRRTAQEIGS